MKKQNLWVLLGLLAIVLIATSLIMVLTFTSKKNQPILKTKESIVQTTSVPVNNQPSRLPFGYLASLKDILSPSGESIRVEFDDVNLHPEYPLYQPKSMCQLIFFQDETSSIIYLTENRVLFARQDSNRETREKVLYQFTISGDYSNPDTQEYIPAHPDRLLSALFYKNEQLQRADLYNTTPAQTEKIRQFVLEQNPNANIQEIPRDKAPYYCTLYPKECIAKKS